MPEHHEGPPAAARLLALGLGVVAAITVAVAGSGLLPSDSRSVAPISPSAPAALSCWLSVGGVADEFGPGSGEDPLVPRGPGWA